MITIHKRSEIYLKSGIYEITNTKNGKKYIGVSKNLYKRFIKHRLDLRRNSHGNHHLQNSYNKYGKNFFRFKVLKFLNADIIFEFEERFISLYNIVDNKNYYNKVAGGKGGKGCDPKRRSLLMKNKWADPNSTYNKNGYKENLKKQQAEKFKLLWKTKSKEEMIQLFQKDKDKWKEKSINHSQLMKSKWKNPLFKKRMKDRNTHKIKLVINNTDYFFNSKKDAAEFLNIDPSWFSKHLKGKVNIKKISHIIIEVL